MFIIFICLFICFYVCVIVFMFVVYVNFGFWYWKFIWFY